MGRSRPGSVAEHSVGTTLLSFTFAFGGTVRNFLEAVLFLFIRQPFDIGDQVIFRHLATLGRPLDMNFDVSYQVQVEGVSASGGFNGPKLTVDQISIMSTTFRTLHNHQVICVAAARLLFAACQKAHRNLTYDAGDVPERGVGKPHRH